MASKACINRLQKEYKGFLKVLPLQNILPDIAYGKLVTKLTLAQDPPPNIRAHPSPSNLLEWHYALEGAKGTDYGGGVYHGKVTFPADYPFKPPSIVMLTASGRFQPNTKLCLSMTDFHPGNQQSTHCTCDFCWVGHDKLDLHDISGSLKICKQ